MTDTVNGPFETLLAGVESGRSGAIWDTFSGTRQTPQKPVGWDTSEAVGRNQAESASETQRYLTQTRFARVPQVVVEFLQPCRSRMNRNRLDYAVTFTFQ